VVDISILELAVIREGDDARLAIEQTVQAAQFAEEKGFKRVWLAEHHNMPHVASSATPVLIGHVAEKTKTIRVGSGGIMLPNHSPLIVAEQFGTLDVMYPGRIDLGLGRAPGTDQATAHAIRRENMNASFSFPADVRQLQKYFGNTDEDAKVRAFPGEGSEVPIWILGSSTDSAYLAAEMGLPYSFAAHFAPQQLHSAIDIYRKNFKPSAVLDKPKMMVCVNVIAADTDEEAHFLSTSLIRMFMGIITNNRQPLMPPQELPDIYFQHKELKYMVDNMLANTFIGSKETLEKSLSIFIADTGLDELMITSYFYDTEAKLKSLSIVNEIFGK
jgi:luciferase family oxidoreductase group 1